MESNDNDEQMWYVKNDESQVEDPLVPAQYKIEEEPKAKWTENQTKLLFELYKKYKERLGTEQGFRTKKNVWEAISREMHKNGYTFSAAQVENKWKGLIRSMRNACMIKRVRKRKQLPDFEDELLDMTIDEFKLKRKNPQLFEQSHLVKEDEQEEEEELTENEYYEIYSETCDNSAYTFNTCNDSSTSSKKILSAEELTIKKLPTTDDFCKLWKDKNDIKRQALRLEERKINVLEKLAYEMERKNNILEKFLKKNETKHTYKLKI